MPALALGVVVALAVAAGQSPSPAPPAPVPSVDPAAAQFTTPVGLLLVAIKRDKIADYEAVITALQQAFAKDADPARRTAAAGWRVYRASEADAKGNALYVHALAPAIAGADYRPSLLLDELLKGAPPELLIKYRDSFAAAPTKLSLTEFAQMGAAPVPR